VAYRVSLEVTDATIISKMPGASVAVMPSSAASTPARKASLAPERKYKCQFCNRAFSRSEHRSRHERSRMFFHL
jgi:transposase-like protein